MESLAKHLVTQHPKDAASIKQQGLMSFLLLNTYLLMKYVRIPPDEKDFQEYSDKVHQELLSLLDVDVKAPS